MSIARGGERVGQLLLVLFLWLATAPLEAAPPTAKVEAALRGLWRVEKAGSFKRTYEIDAFRNVTIEGGGMVKKKARITPLQDGDFMILLDDAGVIRVKYYEDTDEIFLESFTDRKTFDKGLDPMWKTLGTRITPRK